MKFFSGLLSILEEQTCCYEKIYELKEQEQRLVVSGRPEELESVGGQIDQLSLSIRSLENARQEIIEALAEQYQLPGETLNFEKVLELADEDSAVGLQKIVSRLVEVLRRTSRINEDNAFLVRRSLDVIDRSLELITGFSPNGNTYTVDGRLEKNSAAAVAVNHQV